MVTCGTRTKRSTSPTQITKVSYSSFFWCRMCSRNQIENNEEEIDQDEFDDVRLDGLVGALKGLQSAVSDSAANSGTITTDFSSDDIALVQGDRVWIVRFFMCPLPLFACLLVCVCVRVCVVPLLMFLFEGRENRRCTVDACHQRWNHGLLSHQHY